MTECNIILFREVDPVRCAESIAVYLTETNADNSMLTGFDLYNATLKTAADEHAPSIKTKKSRARRNLWYTSEIHAQRITRRKYDKMWIKSGLEIHKQMYMYYTQSFKVIDMITKAKEKYYMEALSDTQPKDMFRVVGTLLSKQETVLPNISDSVELSNKFANFFSEKVRKLRTGLDETDCGTLCNQDTRYVSCNLCEFHSISSDMLLKLIKQSPTKSCTLDPILTSLLKKYDMLDVLLPLLTKSVNDSLSSGYAPVSLKQAAVLPLLKKTRFEFRADEKLQTRFEYAICFETT